MGHLTVVPPLESPDPGSFAGRVRLCARRVGSLQALAQRAQISPRMLQHYVHSGAEPSRERLQALATAAGVSVEWLATGRGEASPSPSQDPWRWFPCPPAAQGIDVEMLTHVLEGIAAAVAQTAGALTTAQQAQCIALALAYSQGRTTGEVRQFASQCVHLALGLPQRL